MNKLLLLVISATSLLLTACNEKQVASAAAVDQTPAIEPTPPPKPAYTAEAWTRDFSSSFTASDKKTDEDGITKYRACFEMAEDKCRVGFSGMKDGFRKVDHLTPPLTAWHEMTVKYAKKGSRAFVDMRVVAPQCKEAVAVLNPTLHAKTWLFMDKVAFMADGEVAYEKVADPQTVKRDTDEGDITERWVFALEPTDFAKLEKFSEAQSKVIRISGGKGYTTLSKESVDVFAKDIIATIKATNAINEVLIKGGGPACTNI